MTGRERVRTVLSGSIPDRVPLHMNADKWVVGELKKAVGCDDDRELLGRLAIDTFDTRGITQKDGVMPRYVGPPHPTLDDGWAGNILAIWGVTESEVRTASGMGYAMGPPPLAPAQTLADVDSYSWPSADWFNFAGLRSRLEAWREFSVIASGASVFQHATYLRGMDNFLVDMMTAPEIAHAVLDRFTSFYESFFGRILAECEGLIDVLSMADDLGTQQSLLISPELFEEFVAPRIARMADLAHSFGVKLLLHTDGNVRSLIPRFVELGVDILDPLQPEAEGMSPADLKREFGQSLVLRGGVSTQHVLAGGSEADVRAEVDRRIAELAPGGGYILSPGHPVLQTDVPAVNIVTMYETARELGRYQS